MGKNEKCDKWARLGSVTHGKTEECDKLEGKTMGSVTMV